MGRIGVDVGGTNTDLVLEHEGRVYYHKVPTTLNNQAIGVVEGSKAICALAGVKLEDIDTIVHGTTTATNITIEHNGAECGMLTTKGFRDILHIARHKRPHNFSLQFDVPWQSHPLVKRRNRIAVPERVMPPTGEIEVPLDEKAVREACEIFRRRGIKSIIIGFMFSFLNNSNEKRAREIVLEEIPDAYITLSSEVANMMREYERFSTAAMNCFVGPKVVSYLKNLEKQLQDAGSNARLRVIQSNGGISTVKACCEKPVRILMSGPAGGVIGGAAEAKMAGIENIITVDIGGTSADISTIPNQTLKIRNPRDTYVSGHPVLTPMLDLITIGAGGGSIAFIDEAGAFNVGPRSAGADPGPACYGRGGVEPTVTDAQVVLGRLDPDMALGGDLQLNPDLAYKAIKEKIADRLNISVIEAAIGIIKIVNSNMALAIRSNSVARGLDPRNFSIMPFGGAGPLHGVALAEAVHARDIIVPVAPGITAAVGLLKTDLRYEHTAAQIIDLSLAGNDEVQRLNESISVLRDQIIAELATDGIQETECTIDIFAECRYHGQGFELRADVPAGRLSLESLKDIAESFHVQHHLDYGYNYPQSAVELITLRAIGVAQAGGMQVPEIKKANGSALPEDAMICTRPTTFDDQRTLETPRFNRTRLRAGDVIKGPAILVQKDSTTLVPPGYKAEMLDYGSTRVSRIN